MPICEHISHIIFFLECAIFSLKLYSQDDWTAISQLRCRVSILFSSYWSPLTRFTVYIKQIKIRSNLGGVIASWWVEMLGIFYSFLLIQRRAFVHLFSLITGCYGLNSHEVYLDENQWILYSIHSSNILKDGLLQMTKGFLWIKISDSRPTKLQVLG